MGPRLGSEMNGTGRYARQMRALELNARISHVALTRSPHYHLGFMYMLFL